MPKLTTMDKAAAKTLGALLRDHLEHGDLGEALAELGASGTTGSGSFDPTSGTFSLKVTFTVGDPTENARREWERYCKGLGLAPEHFGRTFRSQGKTFTITGLNLKAPKYPVVCQGSDGRDYKFTERSILALVPTAELALTPAEFIAEHSGRTEG